MKKESAVKTVAKKAVEKAAAAEKSAEKAVEKAAPAVKSTAKKAAEKAAPAAKKAAAAKTASTAKTAAAKKPASKKAPAKANVTAVLQYAGKEISYDELVAKARGAWNGEAIQELALYVKPEEDKVYMVVNGQEAGSFDL